MSTETIAHSLPGPTQQLRRLGPERDREIVEWVGRHGLATLEQLRVRFGLGRTVAYRRVAACIDAGLLEREAVLCGAAEGSRLG
jgi:hypothetical protein